MRLPICLMIDDPAPLINVYWWHVAARQKSDAPVEATGEPVLRDVPLDFMREFADVVAACSFRGKFTVLPHPAGLGRITEGWPGCDRRALAEWIAIARERLMGRMDITPEILTHAAALDLETGALLSENERDWSIHQTAATLTPYIAHALQILKDAGLEATGVTSPWNFGQAVEDEYQRAIRTAMRQVSGRGQSWYFLHMDTRATRFLSRVVWREKDDWLVSIVAQCDDYLWKTMQTADCSDEYVRTLASEYLTEDGRSGRLAELFRAGTPMVLVTHWQSLFSNGRRTGLRALAEVGRRVRAAWKSDAQWMTCGELAAHVATGDLTSSIQERHCPP
ncbi:MAG: hypothetical protein ABSA67_12305 [Candidatus Brocadiia bacterium]